MNARALRAIAGLLLTLFGPNALACGVCIEDKIAAVYDHAVVSQALSRKHHVAFFIIEGTLAPDDGARRALVALAESAHGVDKDSARVSVEPAMLSVAFDPQRSPLAELHVALQRKLSIRKLSLQPLRVIDGPGGMKPVGPGP